ncbi:response regulator [Clostridium bovifaecis]|uniref:Stage 0 sporulation protein A homolog n=1 Tax=Clostridium bovifaecis TaxID=2184719 RepID=A0A6I6F525_9CLOT|nr:response regulator [Clostridium bovifaecis]
MKETKVVIVDDSPFSIAIIRDILLDKGFNVVGEATSLEETIDVVTKAKPDVVTMDMTMPGTDGLECTRAIHNIDSNVKVIIVSSMMDDEIVRKARKNNVSGYLQKPVDGEDLTLLINRIMASEELYKELEGLYYSVFKEAFSDNFNRMLKVVPEFQDEDTLDVELTSRGISVVMGVIGKYSGRMIFDMSYDTAEKICTSMLRREPKELQEVLNVMGEFTNIVAGNACSIINRKNKLFGLRVAPPTIFHGESINISKAELDTTTSTIANTIFGEVYMNVGFQRGAGEWMSNI